MNLIGFYSPRFFPSQVSCPISFIRQAYHIRNKFDFTHKTAVVTNAALHILNGACFTAPLFPIFRSYLNLIDDLFNFTGFISILYHWTHPVHAELLNIPVLLASLQRELHPCSPATPQHVIHDLARACINYTLDEKIGYRTIGGFKIALQRALTLKLEEEPFRRQFSEFNIENFHVDNVQVAFRPRSDLEKLDYGLFSAVDIAYIPLYFHGWGMNFLFDVAQKIGSVRGLGFVATLNLRLILRGALCAGYILKGVESVHKIWFNPYYHSNQKRRAVWDLAISAAEIVYNASFLIPVSVHVSILLTIVAKGLGGMSIFFKPTLV
jgi:hypothetical protein